MPTISPWKIKQRSKYTPLAFIKIFLGVLSWIVVIYLDVVKSRIQADDPINPKYNGTIDTFKKCYQEGGIKIFGRGLIVMSLRAFPLNGATFLGWVFQTIAMAQCLTQ